MKKINKYEKDKNWWLELALNSNLYSQEDLKEMKKELRKRKLKKIYIE